MTISPKNVINNASLRDRALKKCMGYIFSDRASRRVGKALAREQRGNLLWTNEMFFNNLLWTNEILLRNLLRNNEM